MKKFAVLLLYVIMSVSISISLVNAQQASSSNITLVLGNDQKESMKIDLGQWLQDTNYVIARPLHWDRSDWGKCALYTGLTYGLYENDRHIQHWVQERRSNRTNKIGQIGNQFPVIGAVYLTGTYFLGNEHQRETAVTGLESMGIALVISETLNLAGHRHRPNENGGSHQWDGPSLSTRHKSFPSEHTSAAFALATVIAHEYHDNKIVPPLVYGLATFTAYARINDNKHWGSDVFSGALIGYYTANTVIKLNGSREKRVQPYVDANGVGLTFTKRL